MDELVSQPRNKPGTTCLYLYKIQNVKLEKVAYICKIGRIWDGKVYPLNIGVSLPSHTLLNNINLLNNTSC